MRVPLKAVATGKAMKELRIKGAVINASFPRSGHRFLKDHLSLILGEQFKYFDHYHDTSPAGKNFVKTHDFDLEGVDVLNQEFPHGRRYIVQVRHPLESIISYYEFKLHWNRIKQDDEKIFQRHLTKQLTKWKRFCDIWCLAPVPDRLVVTYQSLYAKPLETLAQVCEFICESDIPLADFDTGNVDFRRYYSDDEGQRRQRKIEDFRFFDSEQFREIESELYPNYFSKIGIERKL